MKTKTKTYQQEALKGFCEYVISTVISCAVPVTFWDGYNWIAYVFSFKGKDGNPGIQGIQGPPGPPGQSVSMSFKVCV